jgi:Zn-dependent protease
VLNLLPIPPLDGGRIMVSLLPHRMAYRFSRIEPYGFIIILVLLFTRVLDVVMWPAIGITLQILARLFDVPIGDLYNLLRLLSK